MILGSPQKSFKPLKNGIERRNISIPFILHNKENSTKKNKTSSKTDKKLKKTKMLRIPGTLDSDSKYKMITENSLFSSNRNIDRLDRFSETSQKLIIFQTDSNNSGNRKSSKQEFKIKSDSKNIIDDFNIMNSEEYPSLSRPSPFMYKHNSK